MRIAIRERRGAISSITHPPWPIAGDRIPRAYTAIKGAVAALTNVLAGELGPRGIRVNAIAPGSVPTPATAGFVTPEQYEQRAKGIPLRATGGQTMWRRRVAFLLSDEADFINGAMLAIDGGIIAAG